MVIFAGRFVVFNTAAQTSTKESCVGNLFRCRQWQDSCRGCWQFGGSILEKNPKISMKNRKFSEKPTRFWKDFRILGINKFSYGKNSENNRMLSPIPRKIFFGFRKANPNSKRQAYATSNIPFLLHFTTTRLYSVLPSKTHWMTKCRR